MKQLIWSIAQCAFFLTLIVWCISLTIYSGTEQEHLLFEAVFLVYIFISSVGTGIELWKKAKEE
jgi:hypothetical protein